MTLINSIPYTGFGVDANNNLIVPNGIAVGASGSEQVVMTVQSGQHCLTRVAFGAAELGGSETNTSFSFPAAGALLNHAYIIVTDGESGTIDVGTQGTSNDPDGILDGISVTSTGVILPTVTLTTGLNGQYISATTFGALSHKIDLGTDDDGDSGFVIKQPVLITGGDPVSITSSGDLNSCSGYLFLDYTVLGTTT